MKSLTQIARIALLDLVVRFSIKYYCIHEILFSGYDNGILWLELMTLVRIWENGKPIN